MTTYRQSIFNWSTVPNGTGVFFEPYSVKATNDQWKHLICVFNDTSTRDGIYGNFQVPQNYASTPKIIYIWTTTVTSGNVVWDFEYRAVGGNDTESLDQSGTQESVTVTDAAPGAAHRRLEVPVSLTAGNLAAGDTVQFYLARDGADASDTMAAAALLFDALFEYSD